MSYFTDSNNIDALALEIIPEREGLSGEQNEALEQAREDLKVYLTKVGIFINSGLNDIFTKGTPSAGDGGDALQTEWKSETSS